MPKSKKSLELKSRLQLKTQKYLSSLAVLVFKKNLEIVPKFAALLDYIKNNRGFDTGYKCPRLIRRVQIRSQVAGIESYGDYIAQVLPRSEIAPTLINLAKIVK